MFIRLFDTGTNAEVNINSAHIASFSPISAQGTNGRPGLTSELNSARSENAGANQDKRGETLITMSNGVGYTVNETCRSVRHAIKKAGGVPAAAVSEADKNAKEEGVEE